jgi:hypothetical protein
MGAGYIPKKDSEGNALHRTQNVFIDDNKRVRHVGIFNVLQAAGTNSDHDWPVPQLQYGGVDVQSFMVGVNYKVIGGEDSYPPQIDFCVIDKDDILGYGPNTVLDGFADDYYMFTDESSTIREHKADLIAGLYIRAHINNPGNSDIKFICNLLRYVEV